MSEKPIDLEEKLAREVGVRFDRNEFQREQIVSRLENLYSLESRNHNELQKELQNVTDQLNLLNKISSDVKSATYLIAFLFLSSSLAKLFS